MITLRLLLFSKELLALERVILRCRDNLCGCCMDYVVHSIKSTVQAVPVADVADKEPHAFVDLELLRHVPQLHLVAGVDDNLLGGEECLVS